ncbi:MAG TPA: 16S rRNA (cytidine(1402)-2'-O)-methyltransferase [Verrucomicrobiae bacterium]|nr:16S rRNA (cytidine(1402)-2'-O)-methyltransferase [Verrucomicrobiae bacterium]
MASADGRLFIVGTPIGNMEDITLRALRVLREADLIAAEDTRRTGVLLARHGLNKPMVSYHEFNEARRTPELLRELQQGRRIALVSDAGMPAISDPGQRLLRAAFQAEIAVEVIPGVSALTTALVASGCAIEDGVLFYGFLPHKSGQRRTALSRLASQPQTLVFFESPHRLLKTLRDMRELLGNRGVVVARELTKKFEEFVRGDIDSVLKKLENRAIKGEITLVVDGRQA